MVVCDVLSHTCGWTIVLLNVMPLCVNVHEHIIIEHVEVSGTVASVVL